MMDLIPRVFKENARESLHPRGFERSKGVAYLISLGKKMALGWLFSSLVMMGWIRPSGMGNVSMFSDRNFLKNSTREFAISSLA